MRKIFLIWIVLSLALTGCASNKLELASFSENGVKVTVWLEKLSEGSYQLAAQFTPPDGYHLYSKDIPRNGVEGLGRPTLLELPENAQMQATGMLIERVAAEIPPFEPKELLVYPAGPVTLTLPVTLPEAEQFEETISLTYMACSATGCKPPVMGKTLKVNINADFGGE